MKSKNNTVICLPFTWLDRSQRNYESPFCRAYAKIMNRFPFGIMWDINPSYGIQVDVVDLVSQDKIEAVITRSLAFLERQRVKRVIQ